MWPANKRKWKKRERKYLDIIVPNKHFYKLTEEPNLMNFIIIISFYKFVMCNCTSIRIKNIIFPFINFVSLFYYYFTKNNTQNRILMQLQIDEM